VIGRKDEDKGQAVFAYVTLEGEREGSEDLKGTLRQHVRKQIGALASPDDMIFTDDLPKTRSGKIMRRVLRAVAEGDDLGDTSTLADPGSVEALQEQARQQT
jgi:acetyl-CoA synthetase